MSKIGDWVKGLQIPEIRLTRPEEMHANKNHAAERPQSLIIDAMVRFPLVPPMTPYHPAMKKRVELEKLARFLDQMFSTDINLHKHFLETSRIREEAHRIEVRRQVEEDTATAHASAMVQGELDRRVFYFRRQLKRMLKQKDLNADARKHMLELFDFMRMNTIERSDKYNKETLQEIKRGEKRHEQYWDFRLDNLFAPAGARGYSKLEKHGKLPEDVTGEIDRKLKARITEEHWDWRKDNLYVTLPNGGMTRSDVRSGKAPEAVAAQVHQPVIDQRSRDFRNWHDSGSYITTPNDSLMHMKDQGKQPEGAFAWLSLPKKEKVTDGYREHHRWSMHEQTPNGGMAPLYNSGKSEERISAQMYWPERREISAEHTHWHQNYLFKPTANGVWKILEGVGKSIEHTAASVEQPKKDAITENFADWRKGNLWKQTPNGGYARLDNVGHSLEKISFEFDVPKKEALEHYHEQKELNNRYVQTANHGWARLKSIGGDVEDITGKVDAPRKDKVVEFFDWRDRQNLFIPTANDSIGRLPKSGEQIEKTSHEALAPRKFLSQTDVKQYVRNQPDTSIDNGTGSPTPTNGRQSEEAQQAAMARTDTKRKANFAEFKKSLAALHQQTSAFAAHSVAEPAGAVDAPAPKTTTVANIQPAKKTG